MPSTIFRGQLKAARGALRNACKDGHPPNDGVLMFNILVLREWYALSDERMKFQIA